MSSETDPLAGLTQLVAGLGTPGREPASAELSGVRGAGTAADGMVRAEVSAGGRLEVLSIEPGVLRTGMFSVADAVLEAVQAAQDDVAERSAEALAASEIAEVADPEKLSAAAEVAQAGMIRLDQMLAELATVASRLERGSR